MESVAALLALLMCLCTASPDPESICTLTDIYQDKTTRIQVDDISEGCWTSFRMSDGHDVHILNLQFSTFSEYPILTVTADVPSIIIITSTTMKNFKSIYMNTIGNITLYVNSEISLLRSPMRTLPVQASETLAWAVKEFGGVTSFTTLEDPINISFSEIKGMPLPSACQLRKEVPSQKGLLKITFNEHSVKSCTIDGSEEEMCIINIPDHVGIRNVFVDVVSSNLKLVLRGPTGTHWKIKAENVHVLSNNHMQLDDLVIPEMNSMNIPDKAKEIKELALDHYKVKGITIIYTEIHLNSSEIRLKIRSKEHSPVTERPVASVTTPPSNIDMQLFASSDYLLPMDPSTKVQTNKKIYALVSNVVHGTLSLILKVSKCVVRSSDGPTEERTLYFWQEPCSARACYNIVKLSFDLETIKDLPFGTWELECGIAFCPALPGIHNCTAPHPVKKKVQVIQSQVPVSNPCFEFTLSSVLGIAFGGFFIGVLLVSALWFIKIRTGYPPALGLGSAGSFFSGCPCTLTKRQPVPTNPSPSENSSANGSMGSTQSSMA